MRNRLAAVLLCLAFAAGCTSLERTAYNTVVASKAFLQSIKMKHPECVSGTVSVICADLAKATAAKDLLIDVGEIYCAGATFDNGGPCSPPTKGTPQYDQAIAKLKAALAGYNQAETDLRGVL